MPGIVLTNNQNAIKTAGFLKKIKENCLGREYIKCEISDGPFQACLVSTPNSEGSLFYSENLNIFVMVDGYFTENLNSGITSAEYFTRQYEKHKDKVFGKLNGSYNILIYKKKTKDIVLTTDRYGTRPLFFNYQDNKIAVSYSPYLLVALGVTKPILNNNMVANALSYARVLLSDESFIEGVKFLPNKSVLKFDRNNFFSISQYPYINRFKGETPKVSKLVSIIREVVEDYKKLPNVGLSLSGGLDSRLILGAGYKGKTYTWGYQEQNEEIQYAQQSAKTNGNSWEFIKLSPSDFLDPNNNGIRIGEGLDLDVQSYTTKVYQKIANDGTDGLMTGLALDFTLGGSYLPDEKTLSMKDVYSFIKNKIETFKPDIRSKLISDKEIKKIVNLYSKSLKDGVCKDKSNDIHKTIRQFFFKTRVFRIIAYRQRWQRSFLEDYIPTFDNRIIEYVDLFDLGEIRNHKLYRKVLMELSDSLSSIKYQRTSIPPSVPEVFWKDSASIENEKESLYRRIYFETNGEIDLKYNKYYSNFDEWIRGNEDWNSYIEKYLKSNGALIHQYLDKGCLYQIINNSQSGKENNMGMIIKLITLEKTLRFLSN